MRHLVLGLMLLFVAGGGALPQSPSRLTLRGTVQDATGAVIPGARVDLTSTSGATVASTSSSSNGRFEFKNLSKGSYVVVIPSLNGFAASQTPVTVGGANAQITVTLNLQAETQTTIVSDRPAISVDTTANQDATDVGGNSLQHLPVFDQDYVSMLTPFLDPASSASDGITIMVNGIEVKASTVSPSAIGEVRINDDPYSAEFSRPGRGRINIIPKPGSPQYHGTINFIARDAVFNANNYFAPTRPSEQRRIYEGDLTGPIGKGGHTTFMLNGSRKEQDTDAQIFAYEASGPVTGNVATPDRDSQIAMNVSHDLSDAHRVSFGYNFELEQQKNANVGGLVLPEAGVNDSGREDDILLGDRFIFSPSLLLQLQLVFEKDEEVTASVTESPSLQVQGAFTGGGAQADLARTENTVHISDVVSWTHGNHYIRFGANIPQISRRDLDDHTNRLGTFGFSSLADFQNAQPFVWTAQQGTGRGLYWMNEFGAFAQDEISLRPNLRLTLGLRYQWQTYITDADEFSPRLSMAWSPNHRTVVRAGAGVFYDRTGGDFPGTFKVHNGVVLHSVQVLNPGYPTPVPPGTNLQNVPPNIVRESSSMHAPYTFQYSFDLERQLGRVATLTTGYSGILGVSQFRSRDANAPRPPAYSTLPDPALGFIQQIESGARRYSNSLEVTLQGKSNRWFTGQAKYTLSRSMDNTGGINWYPQDQYNPNNEWGRSAFDRLQRFNLIGNVHPDHWLSLGIATTLYSGMPYNETAGSDSFQTGLGNARPSGVGRNTLQGGGTADFDLLWDHDFSLEKSKAKDGRLVNIGFSAFNVLNHPNFATYIGNVQSPIFRQPTTALAGRQLQFGLRYSF